MRLRDLAGLVVIDFIDMEEKRNNRSVERRLKEALKNDRARIQVGRISHFGLLEMSRQRLRPSLLEGSTRMCPHCEGRGIVRSVSSCALSVMRAIEEQLISRKAENLTVKCHREVASYILNEKRDHLLLDRERSYGISIFIVPSDDMKGSQVRSSAPASARAAARRIAAPVKIDTAFEEPEDEAEPEETEEPAEASPETASDEFRGDSHRAEKGSEEEGSRRRGRRRRGRRGAAGRPGRRDEFSRAERTRCPVSASSRLSATAGNFESAELRPVAGDEPAPREERNAGEDEPRGRRDRWRPPTWPRPRGASLARCSGACRQRQHDRGRSGSKPSPRRHRKSVIRLLPSRRLPSRPNPRPSRQQAEAPAPRHWQPPAPTVTERPPQPKAGWWSKRS